MPSQKAFTLIELIAVLVILAIIVLITTPIIFNLVNNAEEHARKRSVDGYGKAIENALATYELNYGDITLDFNKLKIQYSGSKTICEDKKIRSNGEIYLSNCSVDGVKVKDKNTKDGYYHYGLSNTDYIDKYASILQAQINDYIENNDSIPSDLSSLSNRYAKMVACDIKHINYNNTLYLSKCSVDGKIEEDTKNVDGYYHYGNLQNYKVGDEVSYKGIDFYVIADSDLNQDYVTLIKKVPLTYEEVVEFGENHINNNSSNYKGVPYKRGKYGAVAYDDYELSDYVNSDISYIVDSWLSSFLNMSDLCFENSEPARLITIGELINLGCNQYNCKSSKYKWVYSDGTFYGDSSEILYFYYWIMSQGFNKKIVEYNGYISNRDGDNDYYNIRPVVNLYKRLL